ncbi:calmodulin-binding protein 60 [Tanacetum coccineum]
MAANTTAVVLSRQGRGYSHPNKRIHAIVSSALIVNTRIASNAKVEIMAFQVVGHDNDCGSWTVEEIQERITSERNGKWILQGNTCVQLKDGLGVVSSNIHFTHNSEHTKNGMYRLGAIVVDVDLTNGTQVVWTETFLLQDHCSTCKLNHPDSTSDELVIAEMAKVRKFYTPVVNGYYL